MFRTTCKFVAICVLATLAGVCMVSGQGPSNGGSDGGVPSSKDKSKPAPKSKLEEMLAQALKDNPDIRVARAKQEEAKAQLNQSEAIVNRAILQVAQKITSLYNSIEMQKEVVSNAEEQFAFRKKEHESSRVISDSLAVTKTMVITEKAKLAEFESQLSLLLGTTPPGGEGPRIGQADSTCVQCHQNPFPDAMDNKTVIAAHHGLGFKADWLLTRKVTKGPIAEKIRKAMDQDVTVKYKQMSGYEILQDLLKNFEGVPIVVESGFSKSSHIKCDLDVKEPLPLGAALQMLSDESNLDFRIVIREYGLRVCQKSIPSGAVTLHDFWKNVSKDSSKVDGDKKSNRN